MFDLIPVIEAGVGGLVVSTPNLFSACFRLILSRRTLCVNWDLVVTCQICPVLI